MYLTSTERTGHIIADATPKVVAVANTEVLDKLCDALPADGWPASGVILLGDDPANKLPPEGFKSAHGPNLFKPVEQVKT